MAIEYFCCYHSYLKKCEKLTDQELGRLFRALMKYSETGERQELAGRESIAFDFIADDIDRAKQAYDDRCKTNRENIKKRYDSTTEYDGIRPNTTVYESYQNKDKDKDKDKYNPPSIPPSGGKRDVFAEFAGEDQTLLAALRDYEAMRKKIRKPMTERARELAVQNLRKLGGSAEAWVPILNQSVQNSWAGLFPLDAPSDRGGASRQKKGGNVFLEIAREEGIV